MDLELLIAEDNTFTATQYKKFLEAKGYKITIFNDGAKCFEKFTNEFRYRRVVLKDKSPPYYCVLLDQDMPKMKGTEVYEKIHKMCPEQKIVFLSAQGQNILRAQEGTKEGFLQIIQKPFSLEFLLKKIEPKSFVTIKRTNQQETVMTATQSPETVR
ncbi:MAG: response regulator [Nitrosarchaeum sp.]|nr:response regulator [Nitrosarchaeum sp.]